ncbi:MAG: Gfo/Idh/MocA family oxidoreductase [Opitutae bacterium]|nr:Gfo/Idh/MocA family oxidoreductase [Opitutae bacterium]
MKTLRLGIIGGGLMGKETASALARWCNLDDIGVHAELTAVCDLQPAVLDWFRRIPSVKLFTADAAQLLASPDVDAVYVAVPHHLHEALYLQVLRAGKDLLAEKPFGLDLAAARRIRDEAKKLGRFVRCSSEFPFWPGPQCIMADLHASDLDPTKPINWKRQAQFCGAAGVMNDLGIHAVHVPLRMGWKPTHLYARLQKIVSKRPDGKGGTAPCDTWENALLAGEFNGVDGGSVPITIETKRVAPGETDTWYLEVTGTEASYRFSTKEPKTLWVFRRDKEQWWQKTDLGNTPPFKVITPGITEFGFADCFQQMIAAFAAEWAGVLGERFGCATPDEAVASHELWDAALRSHATKSVVKLA